jgi:hypothetical protein
MPVSNFPLVEERKLQNHWPEFLSEELHRADKFLQLGVAVYQGFVMRDGLQHLHGKNEPWRGLRRPIRNHSRGRTSVEGRIDLNALKVIGIEAETSPKASDQQGKTIPPIPLP